jgi:hypothetical protein
MAVAIAAALVVLSLIAIGILALYNGGIDRLRKQLPSDAWVRACVTPMNPRFSQALVIDSAGLRLVRSNGRSVTEWAWSQIASVSTAPVRPRGSAITHPGLVLGLASGKSIELLLPSRSAFNYPRPILDDALRAIQRQLDQVDG